MNENHLLLNFNLQHFGIVNMYRCFLGLWQERTNTHAAGSPICTNIDSLLTICCITSARNCFSLESVEPNPNDIQVLVREVWR